MASPMPLAAPVTIATELADLAMAELLCFISPCKRGEGDARPANVFSLRPGRDRQVPARPPFDPGAVVEAGPPLAERRQRQPPHRRRHPPTATPHHPSVSVDPPRTPRPA